ncbi:MULTISPECIES: hypothetical protein [unclassified Sphingobium]|uniref:hypothetical protein n=1 Tax=unclassified Sphingobium TaxID=2611147 RepID=UPI0035A70EA8
MLPYADPDLCERLLALYAARDPALAQALQNGIGVDAFLGAEGETDGRKAAAASPAGFPSAPGVSDAALLEARDLRPTTDIRSVMKGVLQDSFGMSRKTLDGTIFPDNGGINPLAGLIRA